MADEIAVGPRIKNNGIDAYRVIFYVALDSQKIKTVDGQAGSDNIVETPGTDLPAWARFSAAVKDALNNGEGVWAERQIDIHPGDTASDLLSRAQAEYASWAGGVQGKYDDKYAKIGTLLDAT